MEESLEGADFSPKKDKSNIRPGQRTLKRIKRRLFKHVWLVRSGIIAAVIFGIYLIGVLLGVIFSESGLGVYTSSLSNFIFAPASKVATKDGRTGVLLLGKAGEGHAASDLTDTIIFTSVSHTAPSASLFSLPRDVWIPAIRAKINSAYYWGNQKQKGGGLILAKSTVEEIVGQPVHYGLIIDFSGFIKIIDVMGGIEVDVERGFTDEKYPIPGRENDTCGGDREFRCRYETLTFKEGHQAMNGETALKFVRSRNADGEEGTDLARTERQQKVLVAIREKILSPGVLLSLKTLLSVYRVVGESIESDITLPEGAVLVRRILSSKEKVNSYILSEELLINPPISERYDRQYVFIPKAGNWGEVHEWIRNLLP